MMTLVWTVFTLLVVTTFFSDVAVQEANDYDFKSLLNNAQEILPFITDNEYIKNINSLVDGYRSDKSGNTVIETNAVINTKYRTWKRNADLINSLLALPKGMQDAGRR